MNAIHTPDYERYCGLDGWTLTKGVQRLCANDSLIAHHPLQGQLRWSTIEVWQ
jgi:hypothetical protein